MDPEALIACHDCDLLHRRSPLPDNNIAACVRCGAPLYRHRRNSLDRTLALALSGVILFVIANVYPFLTLKLEGQVQQITLITGVVELYREEMVLLALLVLGTGILLPLVELVGLIYILVPLKFDYTPWQIAGMFRMVRSIQPWGMMEVFLLGILVAMVKLADMASIIPGVALYAFLALIFVLAGAAASLNPDILWKRLRVHR